MKKYFCKYLPVEGEIKEGDICYFTQFKEFGTATMVYDELCFVSFPQESKGSLTSPISRNLDDKQPYKLFLCSKDILVGDKYFNEDFDYTKYPNESIANASSEMVGVNSSYKVIGEISPDAVWVTEGMEFDDDEIQPTTKIYSWQDEEGVEEQFKNFIQKGKGYISHSILSRDRYKDAPPEIDFSVKVEPYQIKCSQCKTYH